MLIKLTDYANKKSGMLMIHSTYLATPYCQQELSHPWRGTYANSSLASSALPCVSSTCQRHRQAACASLPRFPLSSSCKQWTAGHRSSTQSEQWCDRTCTRTSGLWWDQKGNNVEQLTTAIFLIAQTLLRILFLKENFYFLRPHRHQRSLCPYQ